MHEHTGLNIYEIGELQFDEYLFLRREAYIYTLQKTETGREYLEKCWVLEQTEPDRKKLKEKFNKQ